MKQLVLTVVLAFATIAQTNKPAPKAEPAPAISEKGMLQLQLIAQDQKPVQDALQTVVNAAVQTFNLRRIEVISRECKEHGSSMETGECGWDQTNNTLVIKPKPAPPAAPATQPVPATKPKN